MVDAREVLALENPDGLVFWPMHQVASLRPDFGGRLQAVLADGSVAHRPGPMPTEGPWTALADDSLVHPELVNPQDAFLVDPAGFQFPLAALVPQPLGPETVLPAIGCRPGEVLYLQGEDNDAWWYTDGGRVHAGPSAQQAASLHPNLVPAGRGTYVNRRRLRSLFAEQHRFRLVLDQGSELTVSWGAREGLTAGLGLPALYHLEPCLLPLLRERLRDWPCELATTSSEQLHAWFDAPDCHPAALQGGPRRLIANLIWQTLRYHQRGIHTDYGTDHRPFWYVPIVATLYRAGMLPAEAREWQPPESLAELESTRGNPAVDLYKLYQEVIGTLVGTTLCSRWRKSASRIPGPTFVASGRPGPRWWCSPKKSVSWRRSTRWRRSV